MPRAVKVETIDGTRYRVRMLGGVDASRALLPAMRIAPALFEAGAAIAAGRFGRAAVCMQAVREEDLQALIGYFEAASEYEQKTPGAVGKNGPIADAGMFLPMTGAFDDHFAGRVPSMIRWIKFCYELNFADFLADLVPSTTAPKTETPPTDPSPPT